MYKRTLALALALACLLFTATGCAKDDFTELATDALLDSPASQTEAAPTLLPNPLTGLATLTAEQQGKRPVAVMINNLEQAQAVQCGLNSADVVFECLVEGGISRLMAVFYDVSAAEQIGSVRSARYTYVQLARGLDALYVHCGSDQTYTTPYMRELGMDDFDLGRYEASTFREDNDLAWEHRLYTNGAELQQDFADHEFRTTVSESKPLFTFAEAAAPLAGGAPCETLRYAMSESYRTAFVYNAEQGVYTRCPLGTPHSDYKTGEATVADNVFVLYAESPMFDDNYHLRTLLTEGRGVYASQGTSCEIRWSKGDADDPLTLTDVAGAPLTVNPGRSWIAFAPPPAEGQSAE